VTRSCSDDFVMGEIGRMLGDINAGEDEVRGRSVLEPYLFVCLFVWI
jgi:hypothetical protein